MRITDGLSPKKVFYYFEEISKIPRGSGNTKAISDYCVRFAESHGFKCLQDDSNNCIIFAPAVGCDKAEPILLAGHLDMVCEKAPDCTKDMEKEGIDLAVDGDNISAVGTTLGADDGIHAHLGTWLEARFDAGLDVCLFGVGIFVLELPENDVLYHNKILLLRRDYS